MDGIRGPRTVLFANDSAVSKFDSPVTEAEALEIHQNLSPERRAGVEVCLEQIHNAVMVRLPYVSCLLSGTALCCNSLGMACYNCISALSR